MKHHQYLLLFYVIFLSSCVTKPTRQVINLNGQWEITKTQGKLPNTFSSVTSVPGLVDIAIPSIDTTDTNYKDGWYWYKRTFKLNKTDFDVIELKVYKAKYHTKVYINGNYVGENYYCFTPSYYDIKPYLLPADSTNEIIIGVGCQSQLPDTIPDGADYEKIRYIPGIYDNVEITLSNKPYITNIQCVPDIINEKLRIIAEIETENKHPLQIHYRVNEAISGNLFINQTITPQIVKREDRLATVDFYIDMKGAKLWTPESPFLYQLTLNTSRDSKNVRFGMRTFRIDPKTNTALLNEKPYYLRGTNVALYRFFEDPDRRTLPWEENWPLTLHTKFKQMNWNAMRYCIGFPPEHWYEICDSIGFLLQDEYPLWELKPQIKSQHLVEEYTRWIKERWNHPSVVIWDSQNENFTPETAIAINKVRGLDISNRPWENGWGKPDQETDICEAHPYLFMGYMENKTEPEEGYKKECFGSVKNPRYEVNAVSPKYSNPLLINEYEWIWLNRDGSPTTLTDNVYKTLWNGPTLTATERFEIYARHLAMATEYWRAYRKANNIIGILEFCGLGYSRPKEPRGQTSDHWIDINKLTFEPHFYKYVKPAFSPVGLMVDIWEKEYPAGSTLKVPIHLINDLDKTIEQNVTLSILLSDKIITTYSQTTEAAPYEVKKINFDVTLPNESGKYQLKAETIYDNNTIFSLRDIPIYKPR